MKLVLVVKSDGRWYKVETLKHLKDDVYHVGIAKAKERLFEYRGEDIEHWELSDWLIKELEQRLQQNGYAGSVQIVEPSS